MHELIYCSTANDTLNDDGINDILKTAHEFNAINNITGCLLYFNQQFIQIIEGEQEIIEQLYSKISKDKRHSKFILISKGDKEQRAFNEWRMAYHKLSKDEMSVIGKELFVKNFIAFSEIAKKPTSSVLLFWALVKNLLQSDAV